MDFIPIILLTVAAAVRFWKLLLNNLYLALLITLALAVIPRYVLHQLDIPFHYIIAAGYSGTVLTIVLPAVLLSCKNSWAGIFELSLAVFSFILAISFRSFDMQLKVYFEHGSHFLWHLFGGIATHCLMLYMHRYSKN